LRLELREGSEILKTDVLKVTRAVNACRVAARESDNRIADIFFDYLDPGDGFSFEVVHSGGRRHSELVGTLRGIPSGLKNYSHPKGLLLDNISRRLISRLTPTLFIITALVGLGMLLIGFLYPNLALWFPDLAAQSKPRDPTEPFWELVVMGTFYCALPAFILLASRKRYPSSLSVDDWLRKSDPDHDQIVEKGNSA
jgi:hypothetical protein